MSYFNFYTQNINSSAQTSNNSTMSQDVTLSRAGHNKTKKSTAHQQQSQNVQPKKAPDVLSKATYIKTPVSMEQIKGCCFAMCPEEEVLMRERAKMVHMLEVVDGKRVLVKCYSRSAADSLVAVPRLLRPYKVLRETVRYLLLSVTQRPDTRPAAMYDFVSDRLRAVRQDMTVQRLPPAQCAALLEPMIRFHVYYGYKLCEHPISVYDPVLNKKLLLECLKWFLSCCDSVDKSPTEDLNVEMSKLNLSLNRIEITQPENLCNNDDDTRCDRALMESLYILCNLDDVHPMYRYWNLPKDLKSNAAVQLSYEIAVHNLNGMYVQLCKQIKYLCPLMYCAISLQLPKLQRHALQVMSAAYNSKQLTVPLRAVRCWLRLDSDEDVARVCSHYGLVAKADALRFAKEDFKGNVATHQPTKLILMEQNMDLSIKHVFTYLSNDYNK